MKYVLLASAAALLLATLSADATAAGPGQGIQIINNNNYISNQHYHGPDAYGGYGHPYGHQRDYRYRGSGGADSHSQAVRRIMATHSRFRQYYHPRSNYNSPPHYYDWRGW